MDLVEQYMPVSFQTLQTIANLHLEQYGTQLLTAEALQHKFSELCCRTSPTGDPRCGARQCGTKCYPT